MPDEKIQLMIIGAQKAGTTSLKNYLVCHPHVEAHLQNEITCFINEHEYRNNHYDIKGLYFNHCKRNSVLVAKSVGVMYSKLALERVYAHNPSIKIALILRDPVDRAYSAFWYARRKGWEPLEKFEDALHAASDRFGDNWIGRGNCDYLNRGAYSIHVANIYKIFPRENIKIFKFEDLRRDAQNVCDDLWCELGVDRALVKLPATSKRHNISAMPRYPELTKLLNNFVIPTSLAAKFPRNLLREIKRKINNFNEKPFTPPPMEIETEKFLRDYYKKFNAELEHLTEIEVSSWKQPE